MQAVFSQEQWLLCPVKPGRLGPEQVCVCLQKPNNRLLAKTPDFTDVLSVQLGGAICYPRVCDLVLSDVWSKLNEVIANSWG